MPRRSGASVAVAGGGGGGVDSSVTVLPRPRSLTRFKILAYYRWPATRVICLSASCLHSPAVRLILDGIEN